jgi:hypothetical protein
MRFWTAILLLVLVICLLLFVGSLIFIGRAQALRIFGKRKAELTIEENLNKHSTSMTRRITLLVSAALIAVSLGILLFIGIPQNFLLSMRMPTELNRTSVILTDELDLPGDKAITLCDYGDVYGPVDWLFSFADSLFQYSHDYLPAEMHAQTFDDVGLIVVVAHKLTNTGTYTNGGKALRHDITVSIFDGHNTLAKETFTGEEAPGRRGGSGGWQGHPPEAEVIEEWVAEKLNAPDDFDRLR